MKKGFYTIMAAQFFSSLADNALLIAAIALLQEIAAPAWMTPLLKLFFALSYVTLAAFVGALADAMPKSRVMLITNTIKGIGCLALLVGLHPLLAYTIVGFGAAAYSPAKYGILTELLPPEKLVVANGWIEGTTVGSIILGMALGGWLILPQVAHSILDLHWPWVDTRAHAALLVIGSLYFLAALFNLGIPDTGARYPQHSRHPIRLLAEFTHCCSVLWRDKLGQISLAITTLFWGLGATLQFILLKWAEDSLGMDLSEGTALQVMVFVGIAAGAVIAAARIPLKRALNVLPVGLLMGAALMAIAFYSRETFLPGWGCTIGPFQLHASALFLDLFLLGLGVLSGFFIVPMNALLQHRGHVLLSAGHSIAVQNFNENLSILIMLCLYAALIRFNMPIRAVIVISGALMCATTWVVMRLHQANQRRFDPVALIGEKKH